MKTVTFEIAEEYASSFGTTDEEVRRNAKLELAISMYRDGHWSTEKAANFAEIYIGRFLDLLRERGVSRDYTERMLQQDLSYGFAASNA